MSIAQTLQFLGVALTAIGVLIGVADSFSVTRQIVAWVKPFGAEPIHVAFWLFGVGAIAIIVNQSIRINRLEKSRPCIGVKATVSDGVRAILRVVNDGFGGDFSATARIISEAPTSVVPANDANDMLDLRWEANGLTRIHIDGGGGEAVLFVAVKNITYIRDKKIKLDKITNDLGIPSMKNGRKVTRRLHLWEMDRASNARPHYEWVMEITITSEPTLLEHFKSRRYKLIADGTRLGLVDLSISDKGGSQK